MAPANDRRSDEKGATGGLDHPAVSQRRTTWALVFALISILTYAIYSQGFDAGWTFDDQKHLGQLAHVSDFDSAMVYLVRDKGISPTDRPVAMASFLLNVGDWPDDRRGFRQINLLIHVFNGLLIALIGRSVARLIPGLSPRRNGFAVTLAAIWLLHPLLASTSFHVIQRMVLLAATFSLTGMLMFLKGRSQLACGNRDGYALMTAGILVGSGLGTLAKENAALTPLLIAVLELTVLSRFARIPDRFFPHWRLVFFGLPALALVVYAVYYISSVAPESYIYRPFTLEQRLLSEAVILFEYLRQILVPNVTLMGPYQDDVWRIRDAASPLVWLAVAGWALLIAGAVVWRKRLPALSFGVLFFLAGHLLESTFLSLELYFEHRNYLPILGPIGALTAIAWAAQPKWPKHVTGGFAAVMALLLLQTSVLWGDAEKSAFAWHLHHPTSTRATQNLATLYQRAANHDAAAATIIRGYRQNPLDGALALNAFISMCFDTPTTRQNRSLLRDIARDAPDLIYSPVVLTTLHSQITLFAQGDCDAFDPQALIDIAGGLLSNPAFQRPIRQYGLLMAIARAQQVQGKRQESIDTKIRAFRIEPNFKAASTIFTELVQAGEVESAHHFLDEARSRLPGLRGQLEALDSTGTRP